MHVLLGPSAFTFYYYSTDLCFFFKELEGQLEICLEQQIPVISVVSVHGSTEFGSLDPLEDIIGLREKFRKQV